jgi:hypothetical protein
MLTALHTKEVVNESRRVEPEKREAKELESKTVMVPASDL